MTDFTPQPKKPPQMAIRDKQRAADITRDTAESRKVKARSGGRCEVTIARVRCGKRASEVHHHLGGWKVRGRGASALAANKTHACNACHRLIEGNVLRHIAGNCYEVA